MRRQQFVLSFFLLAVADVVLTVTALSPPSLGLGALLFPVRGRTVEPISTIEPRDRRRETLREASDFFVQAFWTGKTGGGSPRLSAEQQFSLEQGQRAEFTKRYGSSRATSELIVMKNSKDEIIACAGVEVDLIPTGSIRGPKDKQAALMSNVAVSRSYRRRGVAEVMVSAVEDLVANKWKYDDCYLYVERRNQAATQLYRKLGYRIQWSDASATTLLPTKSGSLTSSPTVLICMRKQLRNGGGLLQPFFW